MNEFPFVLVSQGTFSTLKSGELIVLVATMSVFDPLSFGLELQKKPTSYCLYQLPISLYY